MTPETIGLKPTENGRLSPADYLAKLVAAQRAEFASEGFEKFATDSRKHFLADFKNTKAFRELYEELRRRFTVPLSEYEIRDYGHDFSGAVFAALAVGYIESKQTDTSVLLSPDRTLDFYAKLYPWARRVEHPYHGDSLKGISVPDGLIVGGDEGKIVSVCEYTTNDSRNTFNRKIAGFDYGKNLFPELFSQANLIVVTPKSPRHFPSGIKHVELPFSYGQFRDVIGGVFSYYRPKEDSATIMEIQERVRFQRSRTIEQEKSGQLTAEQERYLAKVR